MSIDIELGVAFATLLLLYYVNLRITVLRNDVEFMMNVAAVDGFRSAAARGKLDPKAAAALVKACGGKQAVYDALEMTLTRSAEALLGQRSKSARAEWSKTPARIAKASATPSHPRPGKLNFESTKRRPMSARQ